MKSEEKNNIKVIAKAATRLRQQWEWYTGNTQQDRTTEKTASHKNMKNYAKDMGNKSLKAQYSTAKSIFLSEL